jgi:hypothetical protein
MPQATTMPAPTAPVDTGTVPAPPDTSPAPSPGDSPASSGMQ